MTLEQLASSYQEHLKVLHRSPSMLAWTHRALRDFLAFLGPDKETPRPADVDGYRAHLKRNGLAESTNHNSFHTVRKWLSWAVINGHLLQNPAAQYRDKQPYKKTPYIPTVGEMTRLLASPNQSKLTGQRDRTALEILYGAGLRRTELCSLDLYDYQRQPPALLVRAGKGRVDRAVPIGDHLQALLEIYLASTRRSLLLNAKEIALLLSRDGERLLPGTVNRLLKRHAHRIGLPELGVHSLRHAYATHLLAGGASLHEVQLLLGHRRLETTQRYTHLYPRELLREYRRTHPRARRPK